MAHEIGEWTPEDARAFVRVPLPGDDKYTHGVLGVATGSERFAGAAVLGVDAAYATGVGMVRFLGPARVGDLVLTKRPETVLGVGRVDAWLIGSGMDWLSDGGDGDTDRVMTALTSGLPVVVDAGALPLAHRATGPAVVTPHAGELARLDGATRESVEADPLGHARRCADTTGVVVVLKGHVTHVIGPIDAGANNSRFECRITAPTTWLATAGTGDVLAGILGALVATHAHRISSDASVLAPVAATACLIHGLAATRAGGGGPLGASDIASHVAETIAGIV